MTEKITDVAARSLPEPLLRIEDLERLLRVDARTIRRLWQRGQLPKPLKLGGQNRWRVEDVNDAVELLVSASKRGGKQEENLERAE